MANLDTRSKRASGAQVLASWVLALVLPDGTIGSGDRSHIAWIYSGIVSVSGTPTSRTYMISQESRAMSVSQESRAQSIGQEVRVYPVR